MNRIYNIAIVGAGIGGQHANALGELRDRFKISAICDRDLARAEQLAASIEAAGGGKPALVGEFGSALLERADVDIVTICLPPFLHFEAVRQALQAGKHVVCEKPLVGSLAEVDALEAVARQAGGILMPVFQYRFGHGLIKAKHLMTSGAAGRVYLATVETHWNRGAPYYTVPWRGKLKSELGGVFTGQAIHIHDMLTHLLGEIRSVSAAATVRVNAVETDDCAGAVFEMADGAIAVTSGTLGSADQISRLRVMCENVTMVSSLLPYRPDRDPWTFIPKPPKDEAFMAQALEGARLGPEGYVAQYGLFHATLERGAALPVNIQDARRSIELLGAIYHSAATGDRVRLPLARDHPVYGGWIKA